jgi:adenylate cyclase class IV
MSSNTIEIEQKFKTSITKEQLFNVLNPHNGHMRYVISTDYYFLKKEEKNPKAFIRLRVDHHSGRQELTFKEEKEDILVRTEINLLLHNNYWGYEDLDLEPYKEIAKMLNKNAYFSVLKQAYIYDLEDVEIVYYTVNDTDTYIELEYVGDRGLEKGIDSVYKYRTKLSECFSNQVEVVNRSLFSIYRQKEGVYDL